MSFITELPRRRSVILAWALFSFMAATHHGQASSADAWEEFQRDVEKACMDAASGVLDIKAVQVDPHGSENYGFAVLRGTERGTSLDRLVVCAYDKGSMSAEISSPFKR